MRRIPLFLFMSLMIGAALLAQAASPASARPLLAVTETFTPTVTNTVPAPTNTLPAPTATPTVAPTATPISPTPAPVVADPLITKAVNIEQATPGDPAEFVVTVANPNSIEIPNVAVSDPLPALVIFVSAAASQGALTYDAGSHAVTVDIGTLAPGQVVEIRIQTRVSEQAQPPDEIRNVARLLRNGVPAGESGPSITVVIPKTLPAAGEGPGPDEIISMVIVGVAVGILVFIIVWIILRRNRREP
jgi:uncharacterized repeat protein (TIGR01451 family)